jgi:DNA-directed RNA polymerase subunit RPC12/RpoP
MSPFHLHEEKLKCPYGGCGKSFEKPAVLTDSSTMPRRTYYACPHCQSKIDILTEDLKIVQVKPTEYPKVLDSPAKCAHYSGLLNAIPKDGAIPDDCLVCPKVLQCTLRKQ